MPKITIIGDAGSCHEGDIRTAEKLVQIGRDCGLDFVKFQLFEDLPPNIELPYEWISDLISFGRSIGIEVFASVWDKRGVKILKKNNAKMIKVAYSQRYNDRLIKEIGDYPLIVSGNLMTEWPKNDNLIRLFCIPEYPVPYKVDFSQINKFDGFSDHTIGIKQTFEAIRNGARYIEKHFCITGKENCPDAKFALLPRELDELCNMANRI